MEITNAYDLCDFAGDRIEDEILWVMQRKAMYFAQVCPLKIL